jgi:hypothetical protein
MIYNFLEMDAVHAHGGGDIHAQLLTFLGKNTSLFMIVSSHQSTTTLERSTSL